MGAGGTEIAVSLTKQTHGHTDNTDKHICRQRLKCTTRLQLISNYKRQVQELTNPILSPSISSFSASLSLSLSISPSLTLCFIFSACLRDCFGKCFCVFLCVPGMVVCCGECLCVMWRMFLCDVENVFV